MKPLPLISKPPTATGLRDRVLAAMNGESRDLTAADRERRRRILARLCDDAGDEPAERSDT